MKQSLQLKLSQQLTMTPQLQQAIRLLQLSTVDLQQEIQSVLDSNPMLETVDDSVEQVSSDGDAAAEPLNGTDSADQITAESGGIEVADTTGEWPEPADNNELPVDTQWEDLYQAGSGNYNYGEDDDVDLDGRNSTTETLHDHLLWQLNLTPMSDIDRVIAMALIDAIEPSGMLGTPVEETYQALAGDMEIDIDEVMAVLHRIQQFDPAGVASQDLRECLLLQLAQLPRQTPWLEQARLIVDRHLTLLGARDFTQLMRRTRLREPQLQAAICLIQSLNPRPGDLINPAETEYIVPDVFVRKREARWVVELNPEIAPRLRINRDYAALVRRADSSADNTFLRNNLQEARWFLKSLQSRNETLMKVASKIVEFQQGFLDYGEEAMKPMVLHDIAEAVEMHESTISRVTTQKYMHTPRGVFELKYFFSSHVGTEDGGECSSTAIRAIIRKLVAAENPRKPLSDNKIANLLAEKGINVARRTIAKYRESMGIPPSNERKSLA